MKLCPNCNKYWQNDLTRCQNCGEALPSNEASSEDADEGHFVVAKMIDSVVTCPHCHEFRRYRYPEPRYIEEDYWDDEVVDLRCKVCGKFFRITHEPIVMWKHSVCDEQFCKNGEAPHDYFEHGTCKHCGSVNERMKAEWQEERQGRYEEIMKKYPGCSAATVILLPKSLNPNMVSAIRNMNPSIKEDSGCNSETTKPN